MANIERKKAHIPYQLNTSQKRSHVLSVVKGAIRDGLDVAEGFMLLGIPESTYRRWCREAIQDLEDGFTGTPLQDVIFEIAEEDINLHRKLRRAMFKKAEEGDSRMMMYLEDNRFGAANKRKQSVEIGAKDDNKFEINITNMVGVESDDDGDNSIEVDYNEVERGDDSDSTTVD